MRFVEVLKKKIADNPGTRTPIIAFLGDSVTQGCFEVYQNKDKMEVVFDSCAGYAQKVKEILDFLYPKAPVSVLNAGVNGGSAPLGKEILERDVLAFKPDLLIVCFGLNDSNGGMDGVAGYKNCLKEIFQIAQKAGIETIFMTPNMMNTDASRVSPGNILEPLADIFAKCQLEGVFDAYMDAAREACKEEGITICDCYAIWKLMHENGVDINRLLSNGLNHPVREMCYMFAWELVKTIIEE